MLSLIGYSVSEWCLRHSVVLDQVNDPSLLHLRQQTSYTTYVFVSPSSVVHMTSRWIERDSHNMSKEWSRSRRLATGQGSLFQWFPTLAQASMRVKR